MMGSFIQKSRDKQDRAVESGSLKRSDIRPALQFSDDRPAAIKLRDLNESLNLSARVQSQLQLRQALNQSPHVVAQAKLGESLSARKNASQTRPLVQRQDATEEEELTQRQGATEEEELMGSESETAQPEAIDEEEGALQEKSGPVQREEMTEEQEPLQAKAEIAQEGSENRTGMPDSLKAGIENLSGLSMDDVKVHYNSSSPASLQALAYTQGTDIHVGPGQERHLPHEAWHVAQQKQGRVRPTMQMKGVTINDDQALEQEADVMGAKAIQQQDALQRKQDDSAPDRTLEQQSRSSAGAAPAQGVQPVIQSVGLPGVVQRSTNEAQANQAAREDMMVARVMLAGARDEIESYRQTGRTGLRLVDSPFSALPTLSGQTLTARRTFTIVVDMGNGPESYRLPMGNIEAAVSMCKEQGWPYELRNLPPWYAGGQDVEMVQLAATAAGYGGGHMDEAALQPNAAPAPNLAAGALTFPGVTAENTSLGVVGSDLHDQQTGTGVGATRPNQWAQFIAMIGAINPFKQGHQMHQELDGDGTHDNLAPFTGSLNALHYHRVESHVLNQTVSTGADEFADYSVTPTYGGNGGIVLWAQGQFAGMTTANQLAAMVNAGIITAAAAALYAPLAPLSAADQLLADNWLQTYINASFPTDIVCTATFIDDAGAGNYTSSNPQTVTITNDF
jgi:Domain of unknown function (DUF4157)